MTPRVSIVMPVYNRQGIVSRAIESILAQDFGDFEFIIVNDGSSDATLDTVSAFKDNRIRLISLPVNCGIATARNVGLQIARTDFVAIMDSDDQALKERVSKQYRFMLAHEDIHILGTNAIKVIGHQMAPMRHSPDDGVIKARLLAMDGSSMIHPTSMMRMSFLRRNNIQYPARKTDEDHGLWYSAMLSGAKFSLLEDHLLYYVRHEGNITREQGDAHAEHQARKTGLRQQIIGSFFPDLTTSETWSIAHILQHGRPLNIQDLAAGLVAIRKACQDTRSHWGESKPEIFRLLALYERKILDLLHKPQQH